MKKRFLVQPKGGCLIEKEISERLFRDYGDTIWRIALNYTRSAPDADDVTQNTLLRCLRADKRFESEEHLRSWVIRVAVNESKRWLANPWRRLMCSACQPDAAPAATLDPQQRALYEALLALPQKYRIPLYLFYYEDRTAAEIADLLGLSVSGVTTRLARGRSKLKETLKGADPDD